MSDRTITRSADAPSGVIHDIGYRSYTGSRLGRRYATRSLFTQSLRAAYGLGRSGRSKVLPMLMLALPVLVAGVIVSVAVLTGAHRLATDYPTFLDSVGVLWYVFTAAQAPVLVSRDLRDATMPLYLSRPITRADYVRAKFAAMAAALLILMAVPLLVLYAGALLAGMDFWHNTTHLMFGLLAALLYAVVYAALGLLIAASTPRRGFGVAAIMGVLVVSGIVSSIVEVMAGGLRPGAAASADWAALLSPSSLVEGLVNQVCGLVTDPLVMHAPGALGSAVFAAELAALVAGSYALLGRRYRDI